MSWGIAETAPEIEKIKAESADYLGGLNSCGEIEWGIYSQAFDFYANLIQKAYELGKTEAKPHWIPCSERLPERGKDVLVTRDYDGREDCNKSCRYVEIASCYGEDDDPDWTSFSDEYKMHPKNHHVIAWRELPEPYKGVTE